MRIAVIPGDGIGKDVTAEAVKVLTAIGQVSGAPLDLELLPWSADYYLQTGVTLPPNGYDMLRDDFDAVFLGALGDPRVPDNKHARDILLGARFELDLYANYRPVKLLSDALCPLKDRGRKDVNFVVFRENTEVTNKSSVDAFVFDCSCGDTHGLFAHYNALGSTVIDPNIYYTGSPAGQMSWKIVGTSAATRYNPYISPWISVYVSALSAITPRVEILRDGNTTPYLDSEVHLELSAKNTSGSTRATIFTTRPTLQATGSNIATGAGTGSWTVAPGAWSGRLVISSFAPDEVGPMAARVVVGGAITVYADPVIRT